MLRSLGMAAAIIFLRSWRLLAAIAGLLLLLGLALPYPITYCVGGQITSEQAAMLNDSDWKDCPEYRDGECVAGKGDGLLRKSCNDFLRRFLITEGK